MSRDLAAGILGLILLPASMAFVWMIIHYKPRSPEYRRRVVPYVWTLPGASAVVMLLRGDTPSLIASVAMAAIAIGCLWNWLTFVRQERWDARMTKKHGVTIRRPDE